MRMIDNSRSMYVCIYIYICVYVCMCVCVIIGYYLRLFDYAYEYVNLMCKNYGITCTWGIQGMQSVKSICFKTSKISRASTDAFWSGWGCKSSGFWALPLKLLKLTLPKVMSCYCVVHRRTLWPKHWLRPLRPSQHDDHDIS